VNPWDRFYEFWITQQTLPGNILGDVLIGVATFLIGKYKVAPWIHKRHQEHLEQKERQHQELLQAHRDLFALHERQHQELLEATRMASGAPIPTSPAPVGETSIDRL
jgi:hypothetical protein